AEQAGALPRLLALLGQLGARQLHLLADERRRLVRELGEQLADRPLAQADVLLAHSPPPRVGVRSGSSIAGGPGDRGCSRVVRGSSPGGRAHPPPPWPTAAGQ